MKSDPHRQFGRPVALEMLEPRTLCATVTVNAGQVIRDVNPHLLGVNVNWWDTQLRTARTEQMVREAGLNFFRFPGGSSSNTEHFNAPPAYNGRGTAATFARFIAEVGGQGVVTLNYGTASPQEGAALLAYLNATPSDTTLIGMGPQWVGSDTGSWVQKDWRTAGYWAGIRAANPVTPDDGLNFLRVGRSQPFGLHYFEVGNEMYGSWEVDRHGQGSVPGAPHDPATYAAFAKRFADYAAQIDPTISIGINSGSVSGENQWTQRVLAAGNSIDFVPGFVSDHQYMQAPLGGESDANLLRSSSNWTGRATGYRTLLRTVLGAPAAANVELLATEYNSVYSDPGKQTTSLVNGLFVADTIGTLLQTEYQGANFWDLRNGWDTTNNNAATLYGWRQGGDYGMLGSGSGPLPSTGTYVPYPTYFAHQLASRVVLDGDAVISARSDDSLLSAYAVRQDDGGIDLLVVNKSPSQAMTPTFQFQGFRPQPGAVVWQYGKAEDTAQSQTTDGHSALTRRDVSLAVDWVRFGFTVPSYSMTVIELEAAPAAVAGRYTFYNDSAFDRQDARPNQFDDAAIATDKAALLSGQPATFGNVTSYSNGINGVIVDVAALPPAATLSADDFVLETGDGATWAPLAAAPEVAVRRGAGASGSDRVTLVLPDGAVRNTWLRVTVKATADTGLPAPDVFHFGNLAGDADGSLSVNATDLALTRANVGTAATITNRYDFNRDGAVNAVDVLIARANQRRSLPPVGNAPTQVAGAAQVPLTRAPLLRPQRRTLLAEPQPDPLT
jgi:hypothetical protein